MNSDSPQDSSKSAEPLAREERDALAGEYVLGTLSVQLRQQVEARLSFDAALRDAVFFWEQRLLPLTALAEPVDPTSALWQRIAQSVDTQTSSAARALAIAAYETASADAVDAAGSGRVERPFLEADSAPSRPSEATRPRVRAAQEHLSVWTRLWHNMALWRGLAASGFAAAAVLAVVLLGPGSAAPNGSGYLVVLAAPANQSAGWVVRARSPGQLELVPVGQASGGALAEGQALQFWTKADGWTKPVSLGLVTPGQTIRVPLENLPPLQPNQLFELTIEPAGGSPTKLPTGPIQFIGRAVKVAA